jgi:DNA-binding response OmpR family regulator
MKNVLVVSHEWNLGFDDLRELSNAGFQAVPAADAFQAVTIFATRPIAAVIVDRRLPDISVADLVAYFRQHNERIPIVMLSAVMPVLDVPAAVDAVIAKRDCSTLLVPTLQLASRNTADETESFSQAA